MVGVGTLGLRFLQFPVVRHAPGADVGQMHASSIPCGSFSCTRPDTEVQTPVDAHLGVMDGAGGDLEDTMDLGGLRRPHHAHELQRRAS